MSKIIAVVPASAEGFHLETVDDLKPRLPDHIWLIEPVSGKLHLKQTEAWLIAALEGMAEVRTPSADEARLTDPPRHWHLTILTFTEVRQVVEDLIVEKGLGIACRLTED